MSGTSAVVVGEKGRIVVPAEVRTRHNWSVGTVLVLIETDDGLLLTERGAALKRLRKQLADAPLVDELLAERRRDA